MKEFFRTSISILLLIALGVVLYGATLRGALGNADLYRDIIPTHSGSPFESSHERSPYAVVVALTSYGRFDLKKNLADFAAPDVGYHDEKYFSYFPIGVPVSMLPFYLIGWQYNLAQLASYAVIPLYGILALVFIYLIAKNIFKLPQWASISAALVFGFATPSWSYGITIYQHIPSTFFIVSALYAVYQYKHSQSKGWIWGVWAWLAYSLAVFVDYPNALIMLPIMVYFLIAAFQISQQKKGIQIRFRLSILATSVFFIGVTVVHGIFNYVNYGSWKTMAQSFGRYEVGKEEYVKARIAEREAEIAAYAGKENPLNIFQEDRTVSGLYTLLLADDKGMFFFSPILILGAIGFLIAVRKKQIMEVTVLMAIAFVNIMVYASFGDPWGGWAFGPRYLVPSMAVFSLFAAYWMVEFRFKFLGRIIFFLLLMISSSIALAGAITTNIVPPKVEAVPLNLPYYNFILNFDALSRNISGSFFYNQFLSQTMTVMDFYRALLLIIIVICFWIICVIPAIYRRKKV